MATDAIGTANTSTAEAECRAFAVTFGHLASVREAIAHADAGRIPWDALVTLFKRSLTRAMVAS